MQAANIEDLVGKLRRLLEQVRDLGSLPYVKRIEVLLPQDGVDLVIAQFGRIGWIVTVLCRLVLMEIIQRVLGHTFVCSTSRVLVRRPDRKSVVGGKSVSVRVDLGGRRIIKKKKQKIE